MIMEPRRFDIVVVGELNPDLILSGDVIPEFGQVEKLVSKAVLTIGSSSVIFACGAARLGLQVAFIGKVGGDLLGEFMRQSLDEYGIDTSGIVVDKLTPTGVSVILSTGYDRAILTYPGTIPFLKYSEINQDIIKKARHLHVGSYFIQETLRPDLPILFDRAHEWGLSVSLDTNFDPIGKWNGGLDELLGNVDVFLPNAVECLGIAGKPNLEQALENIQSKVKCLGVKLGENGAILCQGLKKYSCEPIDVLVVDNVGAGDSFDAGFIYGYLAGWDPMHILKLANICGGLSTRQAGGTAAQPTLDEAMRYL
jgi:sugar/nucleoside kinase (ribokinase family)